MTRLCFDGINLRHIMPLEAIASNREVTRGRYFCFPNAPFVITILLRGRGPEMSAERDYLAWRGRGQVGCVFARLIARDPARYGQKIEIIPNDRSPDHVAKNVALRIGQLVDDNTINAAVLLFPGLNELDRLTRVALALGSEPSWTVTTTALANPVAGDLVAVHIVRGIPFETSTCPSEALVLGPFPEFPATRRAPVTALEIFVGNPLPTDPKTGGPTTKTNLAHMPVYLPTRATFDSIWERSRAGRLASLGDQDDNRAKAKVSFVIPTQLAQDLGCAP